MSFTWGVAKLVKAADFDSAMRGFESYLPSHSLSSALERYRTEGCRWGGIADPAKKTRRSCGVFCFRVARNT